MGVFHVFKIVSEIFLIDKKLTTFKIRYLLNESLYAMLVGSNLITVKIENFHLYIGPSQETLERSILHYYDSVAKLQVISYRFPERSRSGMFQF